MNEEITICEEIQGEPIAALSEKTDADGRGFVNYQRILPVSPIQNRNAILIISFEMSLN